MKTARIMAAAALIVASALAAPVALSQQGIKRTDLLRHDLSTPGREVIQVLVEFAPGAEFPGTAIRAKSSSMSSKACWSMRSRAGRR